MSFHFSIFSEEVLQHVRRRELVEGEILFRAGDPADMNFPDTTGLQVSIASIAVRGPNSPETEGNAGPLTAEAALCRDN